MTSGPSPSLLPRGPRNCWRESELVVKGRRCIVVDPGNKDGRLKIQWLIFNVADDNVTTALAPYGTILEVSIESGGASTAASASVL